MAEKSKKLGTDPYKGVRDFFPEDMAIQKKIFSIWRDVAEKYGYQEYGASVLEPAELYGNKTSDEIIAEQTYTFSDRGDREVTLRPEMTPTVARMVASRKRELIFPLRWYSIPNLFRYEQPQRGRVREHWQLNADIFGVDSVSAEIEIISMAYDIVRAYGLKDTDFEIRLNNRKIVNYITRDFFGLDEETAKKLIRLADKKEKLSAESFKATLYEIFRGASKEDASKLSERADKFISLLEAKGMEDFASKLPKSENEHSGLNEIRQVLNGLHNLGIKNMRFDPSLMRGFDYYTGTVFEVYDLNPANRRSVLGGGRYDDLLSMFGNDKVSAVGFGAGDVIARDLMETYGTISKIDTSLNASPAGIAPSAKEAPADIGICVIGEQNVPYAMSLAKRIRTKNMRVTIDLSGKKLGDQISNADKRGVARVIVIGDEEAKSGKQKIKTLKSSDEDAFEIN